MRKIWIALPCYGGTITMATFKSLIHDMWRLAERGDGVFLFDQIGHADIYLARAQIVAHFLADKDATHLVMVDTDVAWQPEALLKLIDHDVGMVAAAYPKRLDPLQFMFRSALDAGQGLMGDPKTGLIEVWGMPGGFMCLKREVLELMAERYKDLTARDRDTPHDSVVRLFDPYWITHEDGQKQVLSEDYSFCQRWRDMGGRVWMDVSIGMAHMGTKAYMGTLGAWLDEKLEKPEAEKAA